MKVTLNLVKCKDERPPEDGWYIVCDMWRGAVWYTTAAYYTERNGWNTTSDDASRRLAYEEDDDKYWAKEVLVDENPIQDCAHCSKIPGTLGCCDMVNNVWVYSCEEGRAEYQEKLKTDAVKAKQYDALKADVLQVLAEIVQDRDFANIQHNEFSRVGLYARANEHAYIRDTYNDAIGRLQSMFQKYQEDAPADVLKEQEN